VHGTTNSHGWSCSAGQWKAFQEWRERARVWAILSAMSDRELKDLGFFRSEIECVVMDDAGKLIRAFPEDNRQ
jgi:uncharacterized protein YjiS (DUF1127 family)